MWLPIGYTIEEIGDMVFGGTASYYLVIIVESEFVIIPSAVFVETTVTWTVNNH